MKLCRQWRRDPGKRNSGPGIGQARFGRLAVVGVSLTARHPCIAGSQDSEAPAPARSGAARPSPNVTHDTSPLALVGGQSHAAWTSDPAYRFLDRALKSARNSIEPEN
jgi:hypothetical protein